MTAEAVTPRPERPARVPYEGITRSVREWPGRQQNYARQIAERWGVPAPAADPRTVAAGKRLVDAGGCMHAAPEYVEDCYTCVVRATVDVTWSMAYGAGHGDGFREGFQEGRGDTAWLVGCRGQGNARPASYWAEALAALEAATGAAGGSRTGGVDPQALLDALTGLGYAVVRIGPDGRVPR